AISESDDEDPLEWAFGSLGVEDRARHIASLYVDDVADVLRDGIDERFELSRYGERLASSTPSFDPLRAALHAEPTLVDTVLDEIAVEMETRHRPHLLCLTVPFPGNVYGALRIARAVRSVSAGTKIAMGGG